jgi:diketogulonate reductase-like aldo/keto reductase
MNERCVCDTRCMCAVCDGGIREELFITSKVFNHHHQDRAAAALRTTLKNLQLSYLVRFPPALAVAARPS